MELKSVSVTGFKRFGDEAFFRTDGKLIALVGPNEAGKTSLLTAVSRHGLANKFVDGDASRFKDQPPTVTLRYFLTAEEAQAAGIPQPGWMNVTRSSDNTYTVELKPPPNRNLDKRRNCQAALELAIKSYAMTEFESMPWELTPETYEALLDETDLYSAEERAFLTSWRGDVEEKLMELGETQGAQLEEDAHDEAPLAAYHRSIVELGRSIDELLSFEAAHDPQADAETALMSKRPQILEFKQSDRELGLPFPIRSTRHQDPKQRKTPSKALQNLLDKVGLNLDALIDADVAKDTALVRGLLVDANERLVELGEGRWKQSDAQIELTLDNSLLDILVVHGSEFEAKYRYNSLAERSEGYKQFVALQIFSLFHEIDGAILLIDEIEQHLHYDAQANLVQMLTSEPRISKVIYATHSVGCLPEDLGTGVKLVQWRGDDPKQSRVVDRFWGRGRIDGFSPLLFGMGATTLSFFPMRRALIGEGITETLLLPRLFKEVSDTDQLDFQIVHGLSNLSPTGLPMLDSASNRVAFLTDNDQGGKDIRESFGNHQKLKERLLQLGTDDTITTLEDFITDEVWLEAVNAVRVQTDTEDAPTEPITKAPIKGRVSALPEPIRRRKVDLAYAVLNVAYQDPQAKLVSPRHRGSLEELLARVRTVLDLAPLKS